LRHRGANLCRHRASLERMGFCFDVKINSAQPLRETSIEPHCRNFRHSEFPNTVPDGI
jgi:hypothetical protein